MLNPSSSEARGRGEVAIMASGAPGRWGWVVGITRGADWGATLSPLDWHPVTDTGVSERDFFAVPTNGNALVSLRIDVKSSF